jgi:hypothetical protein
MKTASTSDSPKTRRNFEMTNPISDPAQAQAQAAFDAAGEQQDLPPAAKPHADPWPAPPAPLL